jgi:hypothetical protein
VGTSVERIYADIKSGTKTNGHQVRGRQARHQSRQDMRVDRRQYLPMFEAKTLGCVQILTC